MGRWMGEDTMLVMDCKLAMKNGGSNGWFCVDALASWTSAMANIVDVERDEDRIVNSRWCICIDCIVCIWLYHLHWIIVVLQRIIGPVIDHIVDCIARTCCTCCHYLEGNGDILYVQYMLSLFGRQWRYFPRLVEIHWQLNGCELGLCSQMPLESSWLVCLSIWTQLTWWYCNRVTYKFAHNMGPLRGIWQIFASHNSRYIGACCRLLINTEVDINAACLILSYGVVYICDNFNTDGMKWLAVCLIKLDALSGRCGCLQMPEVSHDVNGVQNCNKDAACCTDVLWSQNDKSWIDPIM